MATNETARAAAFASQSDRSRELSAGYVDQMIALARSVRDMRDGTVQAIGSMQIPHRWNGTRLELMVDGQWVPGPDLAGKDARGIGHIEIVDGRLIVTYDDAETVDVGPAAGDIVGPAEAAAGNIVVFDGASGKLAKDSGKSPADFATAAEGAKANTAVQPSGLTKAAVGLGAVNNTADADKPVSSAQQAALDEKAALNSPALTGTPTAPTAVPATNTAQIATTAFVQAAVAALMDGAPGALDTLNELAAAMGDDPNFAATVVNALAGKATAAQGALADSAVQPEDVGTAASLDIDADGTMAAGSASLIPTQSAVREYVDNSIVELGAVALIPIVVPIDASGAAAVDILLPGSYDEYVVHFRSLKLSGSAFTQARTSADGGATFASSSNNYRYTGQSTDAGISLNESDPATGGVSIKLTPGAAIAPSANDSGLSGVLKLFRPKTSPYVQLEWQCVSLVGATHRQGRGGGYRAAAAIVDAVRLMPSAGTFASGIVQAYALKNGA